MSCHRHSRTSSSYGDGAPWGCQSASWKPLELVALILGFMLFWPIGLAIVLWKFWQRKQGYTGDIFAFLREQAESFQKGWSFEGAQPRKGWSAASDGRASGNVAFDEWREAELARLEEERRRLAEAERDFAEHIDELRRARDREEFDSFMRKRKGAEPSA